MGLKVPSEKIISLFVTSKDGENVDETVQSEVSDNLENEDGSEDDNDYYHGTDSDDSIVFEDDQMDPFDDEDIRDRLYNEGPTDCGDQPPPIVNNRFTRSKTRAANRSSNAQVDARVTTIGRDVNRRRKFRDFNARTDMDRPEFEVGMYFESFEVFRVACRRHSIISQRAVIFPKNNKERCYCICKDNCGFRIHARQKVDQVQIIQCNSEHTCGVVQDLRVANHTFIAQKYLERFRIDPGWSSKNLIHTVQTDLSLSINRIKAYRAKVTALVMIHGEDGHQFGKLYEYKKEIETKNPGSTVVIVHERCIFERIYMCLDACRRGFKDGCRQVVCVDGCFLRGMPGWQLLSAIRLDSNDCMFPIAWAIIKTECHETWEWFMALVATDLGIESGWEWTFMSDKQKGLVNVIQQMFPLVEHRCCVRHLYVNFSGKFGRSKHLKDLLWGAARSTQKFEFNSWMALIEKESSKYQQGEATPHDWLVGKNVEQWCKAFYRTETKCEVALNNICECWNKYVLEPRSMPILSCLEGIRSMVMQKLYKKKAEMSKWEGKLLCQKPQKKLDEYKKYVGMCTDILYNGAKEYYVRFGTKQFVVNLGDRTCACGRWQLCGIPCTHAISCILFNKEKPEEYVDQCYHVQTGIQSYSYVIHPINDSSQLESSGNIHLKAPTFDAPKRGRKKLKRRKEAWELEVQKTNKEGRQTSALNRKGATMKCSICKKPGHNKRGCPSLKQTTTSKMAAGDVHVSSSAPTGSQVDPPGSSRATRLSQTTSEMGQMNFMPTPSVKNK